jgi:hypothetical protein
VSWFVCLWRVLSRTAAWKPCPLDRELVIRDACRSLHAPTAHARVAGDGPWDAAQDTSAE